MTKPLKIVSNNYGVQLQSMLTKAGRNKVGYAYKSYQHLTPTPVKVFKTGKFDKVPAIRQYENSLAIAQKLAKSEAGKMFLTTQKGRQHFYSAAKYLGLKVESRQCKADTNKVWIFRTK